MKVYKHGEKDQHATCFVAPGADYPEKKEWMVKERGNDGVMIEKPKQFTVQFLNGEAEVDDELGRYMLDHQMAKRSPIREREFETPPQYNGIPAKHPLIIET